MAIALPGIVKFMVVEAKAAFRRAAVTLNDLETCRFHTLTLYFLRLCNSMSRACQVFVFDESIEYRILERGTRRFLQISVNRSKFE